MTTAATAPGRSDWPRKITFLVTTLIAGGFGAFFTYLLWRNSLRVPLELSVPVHMGDQGSPVRPWAPWWVPTLIMAAITMLLWRWLALRRRRISLWGAAIAMLVSSFVVYVVAISSLEVGAMLQYVPQPSVLRILSVMPHVLLAGLQVIVISIKSGGFALWPVYALAGLLTAAAGRGVLRLAGGHSS
jgi:hypothetical protein